MFHFSCKQKKLEQDKEVSSTNFGQTRGQQVVIMKFLWSTERASLFLCLKSNLERFIKKTQSGSERNSDDRNGWIPFGRNLTFRVFAERLSWSRANATCSSTCPRPGSVFWYSLLFWILIFRGSLAMPRTRIHQNFMSRNLPFLRGWHWAGAYREPELEVSGSLSVVALGLIG